MSTLKTNTIKNTDDVEMYLAKAWVNFDSSSTLYIIGSGNVTSVTDIGVGNYRVNYTNPIPSTNYAVLTSCFSHAYDQDTAYTERLTTSTIVKATNGNGTFMDANSFSVAIFV